LSWTRPNQRQRTRQSSRRQRLPHTTRHAEALRAGRAIAHHGDRCEAAGINDQSMRSAFTKKPGFAGGAISLVHDDFRHGQGSTRSAQVIDGGRQIKELARSIGMKPHQRVSPDA